jgi:hypothetical protein
MIKEVVTEHWPGYRFLLIFNFDHSNNGIVCEKTKYDSAKNLAVVKISDNNCLKILDHLLDRKLNLLKFDQAIFYVFALK